jgi:hypothetical protein
MHLRQTTLFSSLPSSAFLVPISLPCAERTPIFLKNPALIQFGVAVKGAHLKAKMVISLFMDRIASSKRL